MPWAADTFGRSFWANTVPFWVLLGTKPGQLGKQELLSPNPELSVFSELQRYREALLPKSSEVQWWYESHSQPGSALGQTLKHGVRGNVQLTEMKRSRQVCLAGWKGCSPWPPDPFPLGIFRHPDEPPFPRLLQHFALSPGLVLHTKPTAAQGGAGAVDAQQC